MTKQLVRPIRSARPTHPNERLARGRGQRNQSRRQDVADLLEWRDEAEGGTGLPLSFAQIGEELGISRERVRQLAWEVAGVRGRVKSKGMTLLRGSRRYFKKEGTVAEKK